MKNTLINKLIEKIFPRGKDETLEHLKEMNNRFLDRIKNYGFTTIKEYEEYNSYLSSRRAIDRYPVNCDC